MKPKLKQNKTHHNLKDSEKYCLVYLMLREEDCLQYGHTIFQNGLQVLCCSSDPLLIFYFLLFWNPSKYCPQDPYFFNLN